MELSSNPLLPGTLEGQQVIEFDMDDQTMLEPGDIFTYNGLPYRVFGMVRKKQTVHISAHREPFTINIREHMRTIRRAK